MQTNVLYKGVDVFLADAAPKGFGYLKASNALIFVGDFSGEIQIEKNVFQAETTNTARDMFAVRFSQEGVIAWTKHFRSKGFVKVAGVVCDALEHCYVAGFYEADLFFGGGVLQASGSSDLFLLKMDRDGQVLWAKSYGSVNREEAYQLQRTEGGTLVLLGAFEGNETRLGSAPDAPRCTASIGLTKTFFLATFDAEGKALSIKGFQSEMRQVSLRLGRGGEVFVGGQYQGLFAEGTQWVTSKSLTDTDVFVMKLSAQGDVVWLRSFGGAENDSFGGFSMTSDGKVVLAGSFRSKIQLDALPEHSVVSASSQIFVAGLDEQGKAIWSKAFGGVEGSQALGVFLDAKDRVYVTGRFAKQIAFGKITLDTQRESIFLVRLATSGEPERAESIAKIGGNFLFFSESVPVFWVDAEDNLFYAASFDGAIEYQGARFDGKDKPLGFDLFFGKWVP